MEPEAHLWDRRRERTAGRGARCPVCGADHDGWVFLETSETGLPATARLRTCVSVTGTDESDDEVGLELYYHRQQP